MQASLFYGVMTANTSQLRACVRAPHTEQDITGLLQVDDDLTGISTDGWSETSIAADARCCEDVREEERGHVGEPGAVDEDSQMFGVGSSPLGRVCDHSCNEPLTSQFTFNARL
jgi:hypothetical protein